MAHEQSAENLLSNKIRDIQYRRDQAVIIREQLSDKREESKVLIQKAELLMNQDSSLTIASTTGLRNVNGTGAVSNDTFHQGSQLSWDFGGMKNEHGLQSTQNLGNAFDKIDIVITQMEKELKTKQIELENFQREAQGQIKNEQCLRNTGRRYENTEPVGEQYMDTSYTPSRDENTFSPNRIHELENDLNELNGRIEEQLEKNSELEKRVAEMEKQKEELLRVNHQWDEQYRLLKDDKSRAISEMQMKMKAQLTCADELQGQDVDFGRLNQQKTMKIVELNREKEALSQEIAKLREKQEKTDQLWGAAKKLIDEERDARMSATQQTQVMQERYTKLEDEMQNSKQTQDCLKAEIERLTAFYCMDRTSSGSPTPHSSSSAMSSNVAEQIEVLKQQIRVYADDFSNERSDRERIQAEKEMLKEKVTAYEDELPLLKEQVRIYQDDFNRERQEKERLQRQLRDRRPVTVVQSPEEPWYVVPPHDYPTMGAANAVERRQLPFAQERNYQRRPPPYTPREIQEMAFHKLQHHPRGKNGGALCHGCVPDRDVVDGVESYQCPRCDRKFSKQERRAFDEHIDKCTT